MNAPVKNGRNYPKATRAKAVALLRKGHGAKDVSDKLKLPVGVVAYWKMKDQKDRGCAPDPRVGDALVFLRCSRKAIMESVRTTKGRVLSRSELHTLLALDALEGKEG